MIDKEVFGNVSAPLVPRGIVMDIHVFHLLVGETKPFLCQLTVVSFFHGEDDADFFLHGLIIPFFGKRKLLVKTIPTCEAQRLLYLTHLEGC